jgi:hypothetical protein
MNEIKDRIAKIQELPLESHVHEYEEIHRALEQALTSVEGL